MYPNCNNLFRWGENQGFLSGYTFWVFVSLSLGEASRAPGYTLSLKRLLPCAIAPLKRREIGRKPGPTSQKSIAEMKNLLHIELTERGEMKCVENRYQLLSESPKNSIK